MTTPSDNEHESLHIFPCDFTIKIFGQGTDAFESEVLMILHKHVPNFSDRALQTRDSENAKYRALSVTVHVDSKKQLDQLYMELSSCKSVLMVL